MGFFTAGGPTDITADALPVLGGNLDVGGFSIVSTANGNVDIAPNGTGRFTVSGLALPAMDAGVVTAAPNANNAVDSFALGYGALVAPGSSACIAIGKSYVDGIGGISIGVNQNTSAYGSRSNLSICIGRNSKAHAIYSITIGTGCSVIVSKGCAVGYLNTANANAAAAIGGRENTASGASSFIAGGNQSQTIGLNSYSLASFGGVSTGDFSGVSGNFPRALLYGQRSHANGAFTTGGDSQYTRLVMFNTSLSATPINLFLDGLSLLTTLPSNRTWAFTGIVTARQSGGTAGVNGDSAGWEIKGIVKRDAANVTTLVGVPLVTSLGADVGAVWSLQVTADDVTDSLNVSFVGEANKTVHVSAILQISECGG